MRPLKSQTQVCVSRQKFGPFEALIRPSLQLTASSLCEWLRRHSKEKMRLSRVFLVETCKTTRRLDGNSFVYFTID